MKAVELQGWRGVATAIALACVLGPAAGAAAPDPDPVASLRATAIARIRHYVTWPDGEVAGPGAAHPTVTTCILGEDPALAGALQRLSTARGPLEVRQLKPASPGLADCEIAVFHALDTAATASTLRSLRKRQVLTIGESESFVREGGMLALVERRQRLRMVVSLSNVRRGGIVLSSRLLQLAQIVDGDAR